MLVILAGCSGKAPSSGGAADNPSANEAPVVRISHNRIAARALPPAIDQIQFLGRNAQGRLIYGPDTRAANPEITLEGVSEEVTLLELIYLSGGQPAGYFAASIDLRNSSQEINDPPWQALDDLVGLEMSPPNLDLAVGLQGRVAAVGVFADGTRLRLSSLVSFASDRTAVATVTSDLTDPGIVRGVSFGFARISADLRALRAQASVVVNDSPLSSLRVEPTNSTVPFGLAQQFTATAVFANGSEVDATASVTWESSDPNVAAIDAGGLLTTISQGRAVIRASLGSVSSITNLRVSTGVLQQLTVEPVNGTSPKGFFVQFRATGHFSDGTTRDLTDQTRWSADDTLVLNIVPGGLALAMAPGPVTVSGSVAGISGSTSFTVTDAVLVQLSMTAPSLRAAAGLDTQFTVDGVFSDDTFAEVTDSVNWSSSNPAAATVSPSGLVHGVAPGTATISAERDGVLVSLVYEVDPATLIAITVTPGDTTLDYELSQTRQFTATALFSDGTMQPLTNPAWTTSSQRIATVNAGGLVTAQDRGAVQVTAASGEIAGATSLRIESGTLTSLTVEPAVLPQTGVGGKMRFRAFGTFAGSSLPDGEVTSLLNWTSDNTNAATMQGSVATGVTAGQDAIIEGTDPDTGLSASSLLTINTFLYLLGSAGEVTGLDVERDTPLPGLGTLASDPAQLIIDPSGRYLMLLNGRDIETYFIDPSNGQLFLADVDTVPGPFNLLNLAFDPRDRYFTVSDEDDNLYLYSFDVFTASANLRHTVNMMVGATGLAVHPSGKFVFEGNGAVHGGVEVNPDSLLFVNYLNFFVDVNNTRLAFYPGDEEAFLYGNSSLLQIGQDGTSFFLQSYVGGDTSLTLTENGARRSLFMANRLNDANNILSNLVNPAELGGQVEGPLPGSPYPTGGSNPNSGGAPLATVVTPDQTTLLVITSLDIEWNAITDRLTLQRRTALPAGSSTNVSAAITP